MAALFGNQDPTIAPGRKANDAANSEITIRFPGSLRYGSVWYAATNTMATARKPPSFQ